MPLGDWQFWIVTAAFVAGMLVVARPFLPARQSRGGCAGCGPGDTRHRVRLTVERRRLGGRSRARRRA